MKYLFRKIHFKIKLKHSNDKQNTMRCQQSNRWIVVLIYQINVCYNRMLSEDEPNRKLKKKNNENLWQRKKQQRKEIKFAK